MQKKLFQAGFTKRVHVWPLLLGVLALLFWLPQPAYAATTIKMVIDGVSVTSDPAPVIIDGRTLVPIRLISEKLGAFVEWKEETRTVSVVKGNRSALLWVDNHLVKEQTDMTDYTICDISPRIINSRTFVPLRLVGNALGVKVEWVDQTRTVRVDSGSPAIVNPFFDVTIPTLKSGQTITGSVNLQAASGTALPSGAAEVRFLLLDPASGKGPVVARGQNLTDAYAWLPDPAVKGPRALAAAYYDKDGRFLAGGAVPIVMDIKPQATLTGLSVGQTVQSKVSLGADLNCTANYVKFEITNSDTGKVTLTDEVDPQGTYSWTPEYNDNGTASLRVLAFDGSGQSYASREVTVKVNVERSIELKGITASYKGEKPVTLWAARNFPVSRIDYLLKDTVTGQEVLLPKPEGNLSYTWFPGPEQAGSKTVIARITDTSGHVYTSNSITIQLSEKPLLLLEGAGPNQIISEQINLSAQANIAVQSVQFLLINPGNGTNKVIAGGGFPGDECAWTPVSADAGGRQIQAVAVTAAGTKLTSEAVPVKIYLGKLYSAQPIIEKSRFIDLVSGLANTTRVKTGMSAALQAAQAVLETGWGQSTPVDKYTGQVSYNLFGIKGKGPAGSVTSNTWEEYNGTTYRIDAEFRAYRNATESWDDHADLLLSSSRYQPFRDVMNNSVQGAWALKRSGYATDSKYPLKLIDIMKRYDLDKLDETGV